MTKRRTAASLFFEPLEDRRLMSAGLSGTFVYTESNNPGSGQNAVLAYSENPSTGVLTALPSGHYLTGGTGFENVGSPLGPDDSDKEVIITPDGRFLFAVNQGSNTVSEFAIQPDGSLKLVPHAPFASGGQEPVSLSFSNDVLRVLNRGTSAEGKPGTIAPDITSFLVGEDGKLLSIPNSTIDLPLSLSTAQILTTADGKFTIADNFATPSNLKVRLANSLEPFTDNSNGTLTAVSGGTAGLPANPPLPLGLVEDPVHHIIYSGQAPTGGVATFTYSDTSGKLAYVDSVASKGAATCWLIISPDGKFLYGADSGSDAVSVYSLANPYKPAFVQEFYLRGPVAAPGSKTSPASLDFQFSFDPTGEFIWIVNHTVDPTFQQGNQLHTLVVASNGTVSEPSDSPLLLPASLVPGIAHPQGLAVVTPAGGYEGYASTVIAQNFAVISSNTTPSSTDTTQKKGRKLVDDLLDNKA